MIVGGGTSGWMAATYLDSILNSPKTAGVEIILVESPEVDIIGVGESTFDTLRVYCSTVGLTEGEFIKGADAVLKHGTYFKNWYSEKDPGDEYFHPLLRVVGEYGVILGRDFYDKLFELLVEGRLLELRLGLIAGQVVNTTLEKTPDHLSWVVLPRVGFGARLQLVEHLGKRDGDALEILLKVFECLVFLFILLVPRFQRFEFQKGIDDLGFLLLVPSTRIQTA